MHVSVCYYRHVNTQTMAMKGHIVGDGPRGILVSESDQDGTVSKTTSGKGLTDGMDPHDISQR